MLTAKCCTTAEQTIKGSRFLSELFIVSSQAEVREKIKLQKKKYSDATHVCHAFICGKNAEIMGMSDDGEPGGTAGRPMLDVLKGSGCTNVLITVTRWFGGTLLGTGGLVHAYSTSAKLVLENTEFEPLIEKTEFTIECTYQLYQIVKKTAESFVLYETKEEFGSAILISGQIATTDIDSFQKIIFDATGGTVRVTLLQ